MCSCPSLRSTGSSERGPEFHSFSGTVLMDVGVHPSDKWGPDHVQGGDSIPQAGGSVATVQDREPLQNLTNAARLG